MESKDDPADPVNPAKLLMDKALLILDASDERLAAAHLEQAIQSMDAGAAPQDPDWFLRAAGPRPVLE